MTLPLFDVRPVALAREPESVNVPSETGGVEKCAQSHTPDPDVLRIIVHKQGLFRRLEGGVITGEYRILEMRDGRFVAEFADGTRTATAPACSRTYIEDGFHFGMLVEVKA